MIDIVVVRMLIIAVFITTDAHVICRPALYALALVLLFLLDYAPGRLFDVFPVHALFLSSALYAF